MRAIGLDGWLQRWELRGRNRTRMRTCRAQRTEGEPRPPPPPPVPPPPPRRPVGLEANRRRREEVNRRDTVLAGLACAAFASIFVGLVNTVKAPIDRKPPDEVTVTRVKRNEKGLAFVQSRNGDWLLLRASPRTAGLIYLRDRIGCIYRLQVTDRAQVDLSNNRVVLKLFGDGKWEDSMEQLQTNGRAVILPEEKFLK